MRWLSLCEPRPCPFRRPSTAGRRHPHAGTLRPAEAHDGGGAVGGGTPGISRHACVRYLPRPAAALRSALPPRHSDPASLRATPIRRPSAPPRSRRASVSVLTGYRAQLPRSNRGLALREVGHDMHARFPKPSARRRLWEVQHVFRGAADRELADELVARPACAPLLVPGGRAHPCARPPQPPARAAAAASRRRPRYPTTATAPPKQRPSHPRPIARTALSAYPPAASLARTATQPPPNRHPTATRSAPRRRHRCGRIQPASSLNWRELWPPQYQRQRGPRRPQSTGDAGVRLAGCSS